MSKKHLIPLSLSLLLLLLLAACGGKAEPTPTKTPRPTNTATLLPTLAVTLPAAASTEAAAEQPPPPPPTGTPQPKSDSPLPAPTNTPRPTATPTPGIDAQPPEPVLAGDLSCGADCSAGDPDAQGMVLLNRQTGQINLWADELEELGEDQEYEGWLVEGDTLESILRFNADATGAASEFTVNFEIKDQPWASFMLTIEPEPDDNEDAPTDARVLSGSMRETVMGEALYSRYSTPCQRCHGPGGAGDIGPPLTAQQLPFSAFQLKVREGHDPPLSETDIARRDLQHIYAWLVTTLR